MRAAYNIRGIIQARQRQIIIMNQYIVQIVKTV